MTGVKFCGITKEAQMEWVNRLKPDYIGFVFAKKSRRFVTEQQAARLKAQLSPEIQAVGVFVDAPNEQMVRLAGQGIIDLIQLHGQESEQDILFLQEQTGKPVIRAVKISGAKDLQAAMQTRADFVLLDGGAGEGKTFDWTLLKDFARPYFLAGGLSADNAAQAVRQLSPFALDVSSGIETDGHKDFDKMRRFLQAIREENHI